MRDGSNPIYPSYASLLDPGALPPGGPPQFVVGAPTPSPAGGLFDLAPTANAAAASLYPAGAPFGLKLADATRWTNTDGGRSIFDGPTNGNWCGQYWSGGRFSPPGAPMGAAPPLDSGDEACMRHDFCYDRAGDDSARIRACDRALVDELKALPQDVTGWSRPPRPGTEGQTDRYRNGAIFYFNRKNGWD
jgi:hypothetical protein